jgi:hypothetical protein
MSRNIIEILSYWIEQCFQIINLIYDNDKCFDLSAQIENKNKFLYQI